MASELEKQKKAGITETAKKDGKVDLKTTVEVKGTGKGYLVKDKVYNVHPIHAEKIIKKGFATK